MQGNSFNFVFFIIGILSVPFIQAFEYKTTNFEAFDGFKLWKVKEMHNEQIANITKGINHLESLIAIHNSHDTQQKLVSLI